MPVRCPRCSRPNPPGAAFCFVDGSALGQATPHADPARQRFPTPFVFPSGQTCHTFDELVLACVTDWESALAVLRDGALTGFLNGLGRADLGRAARQAQASADPDGALDELIRRLPSNVYKAARVGVEPAAVNLGQIKPGRDVVLQLKLKNLGMGVLSGSVSGSADWLLLGRPDAPDRRKVFQFHQDAVIPFHIPGKRLRAGNKPYEGELIVEAGGATVSVPVRFAVPVTPYPDGPLAGATTPRQVAEKAKESPVEAGELFASGAVQRWYAVNGWDYPVQEAAASGVAAVQQFFEALGLSKAPKVVADRAELHLSGRPGERAVGTVVLSSDEKKPVWAAVECDAAWLDVRHVEYGKRAATVTLGASRLPASPARARVTLTTNGRVKHAVDVRLDVSAAPVSVTPQREPEPVVYMAKLDPEPPVYAAQPTAPEGGSRLALACVPLALVVLGLLVPLIRDLTATGKVPGDPSFASAPDVDLDAMPLAVELRFHDEDVVREITLGVFPLQRKVNVRWKPSMRFGLARRGEGPPLLNRLTYDLRGLTNNTVVKIDGDEHVFGEQGMISPTGTQVGGAVSPGRWKTLSEKPARRMREGRASTWEFDGPKIDVTQTAGLVAGDQSSRVDTCLILYKLTNRDDRPHAAGLRVLLDTFIGTNDGVPFLVPGQERLISTMLAFDRPESVPDFLQACEKEDLASPGTVCRIQLRVPGLESPSSMRLGAWPDGRLGAPAAESRTLWDVPLRPIKTIDPPDSAVTVYWEPRELAPGASREVGFAYGLGNVAGTGRLALSVGGSFAPGGEFTLTAYVQDPAAGERLTLTLPDGFTLVQGEAEADVPALPADRSTRVSPVTWRVRGGPREGAYELKVRTKGGVEQTQPVRLRSRGLFSG